MSDSISIAVVGGGVVGCAVAWILSPRSKGIFLFEKNPGITQGENQSSRNSGVIHSGIYYDRETRPQKASLCVIGNQLLYDFCDIHRVPVIKTGKLIVANNEEEESILDLYLDRARQNSVPGVKKISGSRVRELEPNVRAKAALLIPTAGIVDPTTLVYRLHTLASKKGTQFIMGTEVVGLEDDGDAILVRVRYPDGKPGQVRAKAVINAAGTDGDLVARIINPYSRYELDPVRGDSYKFYGHKRPGLVLSGMNVYPTPEFVHTPHGRHFTVGVHLTPTLRDISHPARLGSTVTAGPKLVPVDDRFKWHGPPIPPKTFSAKVTPFFPDIKEEDFIWHQAGLQARLKGTPDYVISTDSEQSRLINLLGIDSPGLTSCLAIGHRVREMLDRLDP